MSTSKIKIVGSPLINSTQFRIVFCLPGPSFSKEFLGSWSELLLSFNKHGIIPYLSQATDGVVYYVRNKCLGGEVRRGRYQKPWNNTIQYDYIMWIDNDIIFKPDDFYRLLFRTHNENKDIVAGLYMTQGGKNYAVVKNWDEKFFKKNGYFQFLEHNDIQNEKDLIEVDYSGFGWMLIKHGVFESLEYPWFQPVFHDIGNCRDFSSEDVSFCRLAQKKEFKIYIDPTIRVGHKKSVIY